MKSILNNNDAAAYKSYPKLRIGKNTGVVVLFIDPRQGTVVHNSGIGGSSIGITSGYNPDAFEDYTGSVTLSND